MKVRSCLLKRDICKDCEYQGKVHCDVCKRDFCRLCYLRSHPFEKLVVAYKDPNRKKLRMVVNLFVENIMYVYVQNPYRALVTKIDKNGDLWFQSTEVVDKRVTVGMHVAIGGLRRYGSVGKILGYSHNNGKWKVKLDNGEIHFYFKTKLVPYKGRQWKCGDFKIFERKFNRSCYDGKSCYTCHKGVEEIQSRGDKLRCCRGCSKNKSKSMRRPRYCSKKCQKDDWKNHKKYDKDCKGKRKK